MSNYSKIQFISWEIYTGPVVETRDMQGYPETGWYSGLRTQTQDNRTDAYGQCADIEARLKFTADAMSKAEALSDRSVNTLKVFMAPEFLFRGTGGAYLHDLIDGWEKAAPAEFKLPPPYNNQWPGLFGGLRALAANPKYEDWLFIFGTAISASFPTRLQSDKDVLDPTRPGEIYNSALIQRGGATHGSHNYVSRKHYISGIDFINWYRGAVQHKPGTVRPLDPRGLIPADVMGVAEGGAVFHIPTVCGSDGTAIDFGIEVCLDHARSGGNDANDFGRLRTANQFVKIQLVPSGGMSLVPESIRLQSGTSKTQYAYAFNCDGLGTMSGADGSHTQVWNGVYGASDQRTARLLEASSGESKTGSSIASVATDVTTSHGQVSADSLWSNGKGVKGAGTVRVISANAL